MKTIEQQRVAAFDQYCRVVGARNIRDLIPALQEDAFRKGMLNEFATISLAGEPGELQVIGRLAYNPSTEEFLQDGVALRLTKTQRLLMRLLADKAGRIVTVDDFIKRKGLEIDPDLRKADTDLFKVCISNLRKILGDNGSGAKTGPDKRFQIITRERDGYRYNPFCKPEDNS